VLKLTGEAWVGAGVLTAADRGEADGPVWVGPPGVFTVVDRGEADGPVWVEVPPCSRWRTGGQVVIGVGLGGV
jgi:hypothetical protein